MQSKGARVRVHLLLEGEKCISSYNCLCMYMWVYVCGCWCTALPICCHNSEISWLSILDNVRKMFTQCDYQLYTPIHTYKLYGWSTTDTRASFYNVCVVFILFIMCTLSLLRWRLFSCWRWLKRWQRINALTSMEATAVRAANLVGILMESFSVEGFLFIFMFDYTSLLK